MIRPCCAVLGVILASGCATTPRKAGARHGDAGSTIAEWAGRQLGRPYRLGGRSPESGFDCSGLAWWTHRQAGIDIPLTAETQYRAGKKVSKRALRSGDLVFFSTERRGPSHVGIVVEKGRFVHAPKTGRAVSREELADPYWKARYLGARRFS